MVVAYIGIGSNLDNPIARVYKAFQDLEAIPQTECISHSPLYQSKPVGPPQPDYINAVTALATRLSPEALLIALHAIEDTHGRRRKVRWGPRTLDLDILLFGNLIQDETFLTLPHPQLTKRPFVLFPLRDVAPNLMVPGLGELQTLLQQCSHHGLEKIGERIKVGTNL
jgi:2-amino-4-hydroxy-6-hydroxymethyldihydropteridine diphosphokinase